MHNTKYKKYGYLLDEDVLLHGYKDKYGFHPDKNIQCGFFVKKVRRKDIGKKVFYSLRRAKDVLGQLQIVGDVHAIFAIDAGLATTKIVYSIGDIREYYQTDTLVDKDKEVEQIIAECLSSNDISLHTTIEKNVKIC